MTSPTRSRSSTPASSRTPDTRDRLPENGSLPDLALYERLIDDGIVAADGRGTTIDHLTARRLAIWLTTRRLPDLAVMVRSGRISWQ